VWDRVFEMATDPNAKVRQQAVHTFLDGAPRRLHDRVVATLESMKRDPKRAVQRNVNKMLVHHRRTGHIGIS
jgi:hypothetical protein